ncbi:MAG: nucleotidyltransferase family protein [Clostridiales bacterium]|nr:nucleotidyltransferase family protein [Clostridiales bacterium]
MKICACVAEYNPFHLGHLKHIDHIKNELGAESLIVVMSGNYTQRGEPAVLNKFVRAKHAVLSGADVVIELPTVFATANAEIFATGAVKLISDLRSASGLCFGVESGKKEDYISLATAMTNESKEFKKELKTQLDSGISLAKAKFNAVKVVYGDIYDENLINSPNNILGLEYTKGLIKANSNIQIYPMLREGDHNDKRLKKGVTSATSIRNFLVQNKIRKVKSNLPKFVYKDLKVPPVAFEQMILSSVITTPASEMQEILDCTEGLENRIKALIKDNLSLDGLVQKVSTKRYTETRIRRILISTLLGIKAKFVKECLESPLYAKVLAVSETGKALIPTIAKNSAIPLLIRKSDEVELKKTAKRCFDMDVTANDLYNLATKDKQNEHQTLFI